MFQQKLSTKKLFTKFIRKTKRKRVIKSSEKKKKKTIKQTKKPPNKQTNKAKQMEGNIFNICFEIITKSLIKL